MRDEYNTPTDAWNEMLGVKSRSWKPAGDAADLKRLGEPIRPDDWTRPIFGREVTSEPADEAAAASLELAGHGHKAYRRPARGGAWCGWCRGRPARTTWTGPTETAGSLAKATLFPDDARRGVYADFAAGAGPAAGHDVGEPGARLAAVVAATGAWSCWPTTRASRPGTCG